MKTYVQLPSYRQLRCIFSGLAAAATLALTPLPAYSGGNAYLLKPDSPIPGFSVMENIQGNCLGGRMTITSARSSVTGQISMQSFTSKKTEVLAFSGATPSVLKESTLSDVTITTTRIGDQVETETKNGALAGCTVLIEKNNGRWIKNLIGAVPSEAQLKELKTPYSDDDEAYPDGPVRVGTKWRINAATLARLLGWEAEELSSESGSAMAFDRIENVNGDSCAVISMNQLLISGTKEFDGKAMQVRFEGRGVIYRSLSGFVDAKTTLEGTMTIDRKPDAGENGASLSMALPFTINATTHRIDR